MNGNQKFATTIGIIAWVMYIFSDLVFHLDKTLIIVMIMIYLAWYILAKESK